MKILGGLLLVMLCAGCQDPAAVLVERFENGGELVVRAASGTLTLKNRSERRVHYVVYDEDVAALVDLNFDPSRWPALEPGAEAQLDEDEIIGSNGKVERAVLHWSDLLRSGHVTIDMR